ncbi:MAG: ABC transporter substrate-binding protein [Thermodesulfovibrionales bacterium]|nr:ABC transporter substrate-binding protein [Thermodesulfovibrionales bacterium]
MTNSTVIPLLGLKKGNRSIAVILAIIIIFITPISSHAKDTPIKVIDFRGKTLTFQKPVSRIVCLIESALSGLYMLKQHDRIVAIPKVVYDGEVFKHYAMLDNRIKNKTLPSPGNWDFVNIESVIAIKPDLVIIWASQKEAIKSLEDRGIPVYGVFLSSIDDVYKEITDFGILTNSQKRAKWLIDYTKGEVSKIQKRLVSMSMQDRKRVYFMWAQGTLETSCGGSTVDDLIRLSGAKNACNLPNTEHTTVNLETLIRWNPDIIVMWVNNKKSPQDVIKDPQLQSIKAIKTKQVYELPEVFLCDLWTLKFVYAVKLLAKWSYPDVFKDIDLIEQKEAMIKNLYGVSI